MNKFLLYLLVLIFACFPSWFCGLMINENRKLLDDLSKIIRIILNIFDLRSPVLVSELTTIIIVFLVYLIVIILGYIIVNDLTNDNVITKDTENQSLKNDSAELKDGEVESLLEGLPTDLEGKVIQEKLPPE